MVYIVYKICDILHLLNAPMNMYIFTYNCDQMMYYLPTFVLTHGRLHVATSKMTSIEWSRY